MNDNPSHKTPRRALRTLVVWFLLPLGVTIIAVRLLWAWSVRSNVTISLENYIIAYVVFFVLFVVIFAAVDSWSRRK